MKRLKNLSKRCYGAFTGKAGLSTGRQVLEAQQRMDESRVVELQAKIDLLDAYSELRALDGASLERYGIEFE